MFVKNCRASLTNLVFLSSFLAMAPEKIKRLDFVSVLNSLCHKFKFEFPKYKFLKERGSHVKTFWVGITMDEFGISGKLNNIYKL